MTFENIEIRINNSDQRERIDYSKFKFQDGSLLGAFCIELKESKVRQWRKDGSGKSYVLKGEDGKPALIPGFAFVFETVDDLGNRCPLSLTMEGKLTFGTMRSKLYKCLKALHPNLSDEFFSGPKEEVEGRVRALLTDLSEKVKKTPIPVLIELKVRKLPANPPQYPNESTRIDITDVKPEPSRRVTPTEAEKKADPMVNPPEKDSFDDDNIPF